MFGVLAEACAQAINDGGHGAAAVILKEIDQMAVSAECDRVALEKSHSWRVG